MVYATLGELMLRLSPEGFNRIVQADRFDVHFGGGEANVAVDLAELGEKTRFLSKFPEHEVGEAALNSLRKYGVDTSYILRGGERLGIYYCETGASVRPSKVIYDRKNASIAAANPDEFDFAKLLEGVEWLHISGITPALSENTKEITKRALKAAREMGVTTSFDLNYRAKLWTVEEARATLIPLMEYVDYVIGNEEDAENCLGFSSGSDIESGKLDIDGYKRVLQGLCEKFGFKGAASSLRESHSASDNGWAGAIYTKGGFYVSKHYDLRLVDRVGGGDAFSAGLIYGLSHFEEDPEKAINFAVANSAIKQTIPGDYNHTSVKEVLALAGGKGNGRVQR